MKNKIRNIFFISAICIVTLFFTQISLAANTAKIVVETANIRQEPSSDSKVVKLISLGEEVEIIENTGEWYKVKYKDITGYLRNDLINVNEEKKDDKAKNTIESEKEETNNQASSENSNENSNTENIDITNQSYIVVKTMKLRIVPLINSLEIQELNINEKVKITEKINNWVYIVKDEKTQGWGRIEELDMVKEEKVEEENKETEIKEQEEKKEKTQENAKMYVNTQTVNLREKAEKTSNILQQLEINAEVKVISKENGWCYVEIDNKKGYVLESLLSTTKNETARGTMNERNCTTNNNTKTTENVQTKNDSNEIVAYAKTLLGSKYVRAGTTTNGFDCSGFTKYVYKHFGVTLNRTAQDQYNNGASVTNLQSGDLVMFGKSGINHVGIYIGGNNFIHAANPQKGVTIDTLANGYYKVNYVGARRIF